MALNTSRSTVYLSFTECRKIHCGLRWDPNKSVHATVDLDLAYATFDEYGRFMGCVTGKGGNSGDDTGSIYHSGDDADGAESGDDERVTLDLFGIPKKIHYIFLIAEISSDHCFGDVQNPLIRIVKAAQNEEMMNLPLDGDDGLKARSMVYARLDRQGGGWSLNLLARFNEGLTLPNWEDVLPDFLPPEAAEKRGSANLPPVPRKGESVPLAYTKQGRQRVICGASWDIREAQYQIDVDLTCILYNADGEYVDDVSSESIRNIDQSGAVYHSGDDVTGAGGGDDETVSLELAKLPDYVTHAVFVIDMKTDNRLHEINNPTLRIADSMTNEDQLFVTVDQSDKAANAYIFARIYKGGNGWALHYIGKPIDTGTINDWSEAIAPYLTR